MSVYVAHLVLESPCNADYEIVDECLDSAESGNVFASAVVKFDVHDVLGGVREADGQMSHVLDQFPCPS